MERKFYKISEERLLALLEAEEELAQLNDSGVDNWCWYGEGYRDYMRQSALEYGVEEKDLPPDDELDAWYVATLAIKEFEEIK